jgi:hypothetical protein
VDAQVWVALIVGALGIGAALITWWQKNHADKRTAYWERTTWAFERTFSEKESEAELGWKMLNTLVTSSLATNDDRKIVQVIADRVKTENRRSPAVIQAADAAGQMAGQMAVTSQNTFRSSAKMGSRPFTD